MADGGPSGGQRGMREVVGGDPEEALSEELDAEQGERAAGGCQGRADGR